MSERARELGGGSESERARENLEINFNQHWPKKKTLKLTNSGTSRMMIEFRVMQKSLTTERERERQINIYTHKHTHSTEYLRIKTCNAGLMSLHNSE